MANWGFKFLFPWQEFLLLLFLSQYCIAGIPLNGTINPGYEASQMGFIDDNGLFLLSTDSNFALGFQPTVQSVTLFLLVILHQDTSTVVWTANRGYPIGNSDNFVFDKQGNVSLQIGGNPIWVPETDRKPISSIQLLNSGNLVFFGVDSIVIWDSFSHPTDTLISHQDFKPSMKLSSAIKSNGVDNLTYFLEVYSGDVSLYAGYKTPQVYWSVRNDNRKIINKDGGMISLARIEGNSWKFYDENNGLLMQFVFSSNPNTLNSTWIAVLGNDGFIDFYDLGSSSKFASSQIKIPEDQCETPESCDPYEACSSNKCECPSGLVSRSCKIDISISFSGCRASNREFQLIDAGNELGYFALGFVQPDLKKTNLNGCKNSCVSNCSCLALFFDNSSGSCYFFDRLGSFQSDNTSKYSAFVKVSIDRKDRSKKQWWWIIIVIIIATLVVVSGMACVAYRYFLGKKLMTENKPESSEEDNFLNTISGMPVRYWYKDLQEATNNFSEKLGQGGFGSVYKGLLTDGSLIAVKQLEGIGQGKKEFRAEVSVIGNIHHVHLVKLKGFCAEGTHRLLVYEFMPNGSLDKWIFKRKTDNNLVLDWKTRFNIAVGTAKGLAYLHEDCDVKIVHCDIKPENVLLDVHFEAKVSDFGLAKLMSREQSHVFTTLRGTRGYLAPEWITNYAISEKSDVYSYGMVLLEIIGGRKNYDPRESSEKSHFSVYAYKMMEEGKLEEILDSSVKNDRKNPSVSIAIKVALWCIQEDMAMRPSMTKVVQMLEGIFPVPYPPKSSSTRSRNFPGSSKPINDTRNGIYSGLSDYRSEAYASDMRLSGPR